MMSVSAINSSGGASSYYEKDDYYTHESPPSEWHGQGAKDLGLKGEVEPEKFKEVLEGKLPDGTQLGTFRDGELQHKPGWDLTFSAPKSVSIMAEAGQDERLISAHDAAVRTALEHVEKEASITRIREGGELRRETTGNLTVATFRHDMSREQDPQLHTHSVVMNATKSADGQWRSVESRDIYRIQKEAGLIYRQELADNVRKSGYEIESAKAGRDWSFELKAVPESAREAFSTRSKQVEAGLEKIGKTRETASAKEKEISALDSRKAKFKDVDRPAVRDEWKQEATRHGLDVEAVKAAAAERAESKDYQRMITESGQVRAGEAVNQAIEHLSERSAIFSRKDLEKEAHRFADGEASRKQISQVVDGKERQGELLSRQAWDFRKGEVPGYTTKKALDTERQNVNLEYRARGHAAQVAQPGKLDKIQGIKTAEAKADKIIQKAEKESAKQGHTWTQDQKDATKNLLTSTNRVTAIQGAAGTAKTSTVIRTYAKEIERQGGKVVGMAPTNTAADQLKSGGGISETKSISRHLVDLKKEERAIDKLRYQAKGKAIKSNIQSSKADSAKRGGKDGAVSITKGGTVLNKDIDGKWHRSHGGDAAIIKTAAAVKSAYHSARAMAAEGKAVDLSEQAQAKADGMRGQTWVVDEASMIGNKQMNDLLKAAEKYDARVVLVGDTKQIGSVTAGRAFDELQKHGMETQKLEDIVRQKDGQLKDAVVDAYKGKAAEAVEKIDKAGGVREIANPSKENGGREAGMQARAQAIAKDYTSVSKGEREKTIIIAPGHDDRAAINNAIREGMKQEGSLKGTAVEAQTLQSKGLTEAEKKYGGSYQEGDVVRFGRENKQLGMEKGEYAKVVSSEKGGAVTLQKQSGEQVKWDPGKHGSGAGRTEAFKPNAREFQKGDKVVFTRNDNAKGINNKTTGTVEKVKGDKMTVKLDTGKSAKLDMTKSENQHIDHGYALTAHAAQGATADRALIHAESNRINLTNQRSEYVALSRARESVTIYTDSKENLKDALAERTGEKSAANDLSDTRLNPTLSKMDEGRENPMNQQKTEATESRPNDFSEPGNTNAPPEKEENGMGQAGEGLARGGEGLTAGPVGEAGKVGEKEDDKGDGFEKALNSVSDELSNKFGEKGGEHEKDGKGGDEKGRDDKGIDMER